MLIVVASAEPCGKSCSRLAMEHDGPMGQFGWALAGLPPGKFRFTGAVALAPVPLFAGHRQGESQGRRAFCFRKRARTLWSSGRAVYCLVEVSKKPSTLSSRSKQYVVRTDYQGRGEHGTYDSRSRSSGNNRSERFSFRQKHDGEHNGRGRDDLALADLYSIKCR